jgi:hypothetical protein
MEETIWKPVVGWESLYEASNTGLIKSIRYKRHKILKPGTTPKGYLSVVLCNNKHRVTTTVHRLIALAFIPNPDNLPVVMHIDDKPNNNNSTNLKWGTNSENIADMVSKNRQAKGMGKPSNKLTSSQVKEIRTKYESKTTSYDKLAAEFQVCATTIRMIILKEKWKYV